MSPWEPAQGEVKQWTGVTLLCPPGPHRQVAGAWPFTWSEDVIEDVCRRQMIWVSEQSQPEEAQGALTHLFEWRDRGHGAQKSIRSQPGDTEVRFFSIFKYFGGGIIALLYGKQIDSIEICPGLRFFCWGINSETKITPLFSLNKHFTLSNTGDI